jgi:hypothetical protein
MNAALEIAQRQCRVQSGLVQEALYFKRSRSLNKLFGHGDTLAVCRRLFDEIVRLLGADSVPKWLNTVVSQRQ